MIRVFRIILGVIVIPKAYVFTGLAGLLAGIPLIFYGAPIVRASTLYESSNFTATPDTFTLVGNSGGLLQVGEEFIASASGNITSVDFWYKTEEPSVSGLCYMAIHAVNATGTELWREKWNCPAEPTGVIYNVELEATSSVSLMVGVSYAIMLGRFPVSGTDRPSVGYSAQAGLFVQEHYSTGWTMYDVLATKIRVNAGDGGEDGEPTYTHFYDLWPTMGLTVTTTLVEMSTSYCMSSTTYPYEKVGFQVYDKSRTWTFDYDYLPAEFGCHHISLPFTLNSDTAYSMRALLMNSTTPISFVMSDPREFYVISNPYPDIFGEDLPDIREGFATSTCSINNPTGCIQNALVWAFLPQEEDWDLLIDAFGLVSVKPPFGYLTLLKEELGLISGTSSGAFWLVVGSTTMTHIFDPLRTGLSVVMWLMFASWLLWTLRALNL